MRKKTVSYLVIIMLGLGHVFAQDRQSNVKKYWVYRERFFKYFISTNEGNKKGTNIPATLIKNQDIEIATRATRETPKSLYYGDGNATLQYYIGWLATEYKMFKIYNQDITETAIYLNQALDALARLDNTAESYFRNSQMQYDLIDNNNGFCIRDDVDSSLKINDIKFSDYSIRSCLTENRKYLPNDYSNIKDFEASKDSKWSLLLNLALVYNLVDDLTIKEKARNQALTMITKMQTPLGWFIINPVKSSVINSGLKGRGTIDEGLSSTLYSDPLYSTLFKFSKIDNFHTALSYGFTKAADYFSNEAPGKYKSITNYFSSSLDPRNAILFKLNMVYYTSFNPSFLSSLDYQPFSSYSYKALAAIADIDPTITLSDILPNPIMITIPGHLNPIYPFNWIPTHEIPEPIQQATAKFILNNLPIDLHKNGNAYDYVGSNIGDYKYIHLPFYYLLLHGRNRIKSTLLNNDLSIAQPIETLLNKAPACGLYKYEGDNQDVWCRDSWLTIPEYNPTWAGEYNGVEYLLMHNLNWLVNYVPYESSITITDAFPQKDKGNTTKPLIQRASHDITCTSPLNVGADVKLYSTTIQLNAGFKAVAGSKFQAIAALGEGVPNFIKQKNQGECDSYNDAVLLPPQKKSYIELPENTGSIDNLLKTTIPITVQISPNPNNGFFSITVSGVKGESIIKVFNLEGIPVLNEKMYGSQATFSLTGSGVYVLSVQNGSQVIKQKMVCY